MPAYPQFISRATRHRMVLKPSMPHADGLGIVRHDKSTTVEFTKGLFTADDRAAKKLGFDSHKALADAIRERLEDLDAAGQTREVWEMGNEPGRLKPSDEEMHEWITDAGLRHNVDKLKELKELEVVGDGERGGHNRPGVLSAIDTALGVLTEGKEGKRRPGRPHPPKEPVA